MRRPILLPKTIRVGDVTGAVGIDPTTATVYVAGSVAGSSNSFSWTVSVIDEKADAVTHTIAVPGPLGGGVVADPTTGTVYIANDGTPADPYGSISVIDEKTDTVTHNIPVGSSPADLAVDPSTGTIYVANYSDNTVSVIDEKTDAVTHTIAVGNQPVAVGIDPSTGLVFMDNIGDGAISVIDEKTVTVRRTIPVAGSGGLSVDSATGTIYLTNGGSYDNAGVLANGTVSVIDEKTDTVTQSSPVGSNPTGVAVNPFTGTIYVTNYDSDTVSVVTPSGGNRPTAGGTVRLHVAAPGTSTVLGDLSVTGNDGPGFVTVYPCTETRPFAANITYGKGETVSNEVAVAPDANGDVCFYTWLAPI